MRRRRRRPRSGRGACGRRPALRLCLDDQQAAGHPGELAGQRRPRGRPALPKISSRPPRIAEPACGPAEPSIVSRPPPSCRPACAPTSPITRICPSVIPAPTPSKRVLPPSKTISPRSPPADPEDIADGRGALAPAEPDRQHRALVLQPGQPRRGQRRQIEPLRRLGNQGEGERLHGISSFRW